MELLVEHGKWIKGMVAFIILGSTQVEIKQKKIPRGEKGRCEQTSDFSQDLGRWKSPAGVEGDLERSSSSTHEWLQLGRPVSQELNFLWKPREAPAWRCRGSGGQGRGSSEQKTGRWFQRLISRDTERGNQTQHRGRRERPGLKRG